MIEHLLQVPQETILIFKGINEQYGEQHLGRLEQGDICFMYVNNIWCCELLAGLLHVGTEMVYEGNDRLIC